VDATTVLDLSHESLIRLWSNLSDWAAEERAEAEYYRWLLRTARAWNKGEAERLQARALKKANAWEQERRPLAAAAWAELYGGDYSLVADFLEKSRAAHRLRRWVLAGSVLASVAVFGSLARMLYVDWHVRAERQVYRLAIAERATLIADPHLSLKFGAL